MECWGFLAGSKGLGFVYGLGSVLLVFGRSLNGFLKISSSVLAAGSGSYFADFLGLYSWIGSDNERRSLKGACKFDIGA